MIRACESSSAGITVGSCFRRLAFALPVTAIINNEYIEIEAVGNTSIEIHVEAWVQRDRSRNTVKVTEAKFKFVALGVDGRPRPIPTD